MDIPRSDVTTRRRRLAVRVAIATLFLAGGALALSRQKPAAPPLSRSQAWIDTVRRGPLKIEVHGSGVLTPEDVQWVSATTDGRVERVLVLPGTAVTADAELMVIQNAELQQSATTAALELRAAEAELQTRANQVESALLAQEAVVATVRAESEEARLRADADADLAAAGLISDLTRKFSHGRASQLALRLGVEEKRLALARQNRLSDIATAAARVEQLRALVALKQEQREGLRVRAGRAGVVQQVAVEAGQRVTSGAVLARIAAPHPLKAVIQVAEVQAVQIAAGQSVVVDTHNGVVTGVVSRIDPSVRNGSVTVDVRLPQQLPAGARPDLSVDATITIARIADALFVGRPVQAEGKGVVRLFRIDGRGEFATRTTVRVGRVSYNAVEILGGLAAGDRVILSDTSAFDRYDRIAITD
jgi:HlyD family secretion protein